MTSDNLAEGRLVDTGSYWFQRGGYIDRQLDHAISTSGAALLGEVRIGHPKDPRLLVCCKAPLLRDPEERSHPGSGEAATI